MPYKLIRDNIGRRIKKDEGHKIKIASECDMRRLLEIKLAEELAELKESDFNDIFEYADVLTVLFAIARRKGITRLEILKAMDRKDLYSGEFDECYLLEIPDNK